MNITPEPVSVHDISGVTSSTSFSTPLLGSVASVGSETLTPQVLRGKQIFYNADDTRMSDDGYLSCASCHLDGGHDGRTWDFTGRGEGLRNTISMIGKRGTGHGNHALYDWVFFDDHSRLAAAAIWQEDVQ